MLSKMKLLVVSLWRLLNINKDNGDSKRSELIDISYELSSFGYFTQSTVAEYLKFTCRTVAENSSHGAKMTILLNAEGIKDDKSNSVNCDVKDCKDNDNKINNINDIKDCKDGKSDVKDSINYNFTIIKDSNNRNEEVKNNIIKSDCVAYSFTYNNICCVIITDTEYPKHIAFNIIFKQWRKYNNRNKNDDGKDISNKIGSIKEFQDPKTFDKITRIRQEIKEVKEIMHENIESVIRRGETLQSLIEKSSDLSASSKIFAKETKRMNRCCKWY